MDRKPTPCADNLMCRFSDPNTEQCVVCGWTPMQLTTPLIPRVTLDEPGRFIGTTCNLCGGLEAIKSLGFVWTEHKEGTRPPHSGGTRIAICADCRVLTRLALAES